MTLRPRSWPDWAVYFGSPAAGAGLWWWVMERSGKSEAWDADLYWSTSLAAMFALGLLLGSTRITAPGYLIAALVFASHLVLVQVQADEGGPLFAVAIVVFWPIYTAFFGTVAMAGVLLNRRARRVLRPA